MRCTGTFLLLVVTANLALVAASVRAEQAPAERPDPTRLDVERLPPEAVVLTRDMFAQGFFLETQIGALGFAGGVGDVSLPGADAEATFGYEFTGWFSLGAGLALSIHSTDARPPPREGVFEVIEVLAHARLQWPLSVRAALWLGAEGGMCIVPGNLLSVFGLPHADELGPAYGASLGLDWHLWSRHHSIGLLGGARLLPTLNGPAGESAVGIHGAVYLKYSF